MARTKQYVREDVVQRACSLFLAKGYDSTSLAELMAVTGLNKRSLYNEFGNKEALFMVVLKHYIRSEAKVIGPLLSQQPLGVDNIKEYFEHLFKRVSTTGCLLTLSINEQASLSDDAVKQVNNTLRSIEEGFVRNLSALRHYTKPQIVMHARNLLALMQGFNTLTRSPALREANLPSLLLYLESLRD